MKLCFALLLLLSLTPVELSAHPLAPILWELQENSPGEFNMLWKTPRNNVLGSRVTPHLPEHCRALEGSQSQLLPYAIAYRSKVKCDGPVAGAQFWAGSIGSSKNDVIFRIRLADKREFQSVLNEDRPMYVVPEQVNKFQVLRDYSILGLDHIFEGLDHLLFILGLFLLVRGFPQMIGTVTAFTLGHSITLSLAALGWIGFSQRLMEILIAFSLLYLAYELTRVAAGKLSFLSRRPWTLAALFGLLHGLGFAGALLEIGLPQGAIFFGLLGFNLGIELGQLLFLLGLGVLAWMAARLKIFPVRLFRQLSIYAIGSLSVFWILDRLALFLNR